MKAIMNLTHPVTPPEQLITGVNGTGNHVVGAPLVPAKPAPRELDSAARMRRIRALIDEIRRHGAR